MRGRKKRRGARRLSRASLVAAVLALIVLAGAIGLIVRGDRTPHAVKHRAHAVSVRTPAPSLDSRPAPGTAVIAPSPAVVASAAPRTAATTAAPAAAEPAAHLARLAIIIDDCGQWVDTERAFIELPAALTLSVLPHVRYGAQIANEAIAAGKGVMLHLPMEPESGVNPGPGEITTAMDDAAIAAQVRDDLAAVPLAAGVNNHEGSRATSDARVMRDVAAVLAQRNVFFIDSRTSAASVALREAGAAGIPTAARDVFLDNVADVASTEAQLRRAAAIAHARGSAIAIGHPRPTTLAAVRALLPELQHDGIAFVLARDLAH